MKLSSSICLVLLKITNLVMHYKHKFFIRFNESISILNMSNPRYLCVN